MSTVTQLATELTNLVSESRRRNTEIKTACEASLSILKSYKGTNEAQFLQSLSQSAHFIDPYILSCSSRNAKFSAIAIQSLHKLIQFKAIPVSKLDELIDSFLEATHLAVDIQLRVLQVLPTLSQSYSANISGELVAKMLLICSILQSYNKTPMVVNTAGATEQQIILAMFEKVVEEDKNDQSTVVKKFEITVDEGEIVKVSKNAYDCFTVFNDFCLLIERQKPLFLKFNSISESLGFEMLESVLLNYEKIFYEHVEFGFLLRTKITPLLLRFFSNHKDFPIVVRVSRIILQLVKSQLSILEIETEVILSLLTHVITKDSNLPNWKKILSLEIFSNIFKDFALVKSIYQTYDYDYNNGKKKIIEDFLQSLNNLVKEPISEKILNTQEIVRVPEPTERSITTQNSSIKIQYLELLDKLEPPSVPDTYQIYLVLTIINSFGEGLGKYVLNKSKTTTVEPNGSSKSTFAFLSDLSEEEQTQLDFLVLKSIITSTVDSIVNVGNDFLYSCLGSELFHSLIRSLQKLCHSSGILGLERQRDSLLLLFSIATVSNVSKTTLIQSQSRTNSVVTGLDQQHYSSDSRKFHPRHLNSRHVICFRALTSLTVSLGPIFTKSWNFILITFQWFDYYLNGPSSYILFKERSGSVTAGTATTSGTTSGSPNPDISQSDLKLIENSLVKLNESTRHFSDIAFNELVGQLVLLSKRAIFEEKSGVDDPLFNNELNVCPYNQEFFVDRLTEFAVVNAERFVHDDSDVDVTELNDSEHVDFWDVIVNGFLNEILTSNDQSFDSLEVKRGISNNFNVLIKEIAKFAFKQQSTTNDDGNGVISASSLASTETKLFNSISKLVQTLRSSNKEVSNIDLEIIHALLRSIFDLLDRFGNSFRNSWIIILSVIDSSFEFLKSLTNKVKPLQPSQSSDELNGDGYVGISNAANLNNLNNSKGLLKSSFEIIQLILNDFLQSIKPLTTTKSIIDILNKFVSQDIDLNISFSAVSYYWLLSDFFRQKYLELSNNGNNNVQGSEDQVFETFEDLEKSLESTNELENVNALWLYLLNSLVKISNDTRIEIKNVAIQTFFRIVDSHGSYLNWYKTFNIVVKDLLLIDLRKPGDASDGNESGSAGSSYESNKVFVDNVLITLNGVNDLYSLFFINYKDEVFWNSLLDFYNRLIALNIIEISTNIYVSFNKILKLFELDVPEHLFQIFFKFWSEQKIRYVSKISDSSTFQSSTVELIKSFELLYVNKQSELSRSQIESSLTIFNNAIRFPFLPSVSTNDINNPTELQAVVLRSFEMIDINEDLQDLVLLQISNLIQLPFGTRSRILKKLNNVNKNQISTFIAVSNHAISILSSYFSKLDSFETLVFKDDIFLKILGNLLDPIKHHLSITQEQGVLDPTHFININTQEIWKKSLSLIVSIIYRFLPLLNISESSSSNNFPIAKRLWSLIIETITLTLPHLNDNRDTDYNLKTYEILKPLILTNLHQDSLTDINLQNLISSIWKSSFLYDNNMLENYLFENNTSPSDLTHQILKLPVDGYSTEPLHLQPQQEFRLLCLSDLFQFSSMAILNGVTPEQQQHPDQQQHALKLVNITLPFLLSRVVLIIKRYADQQKLVYRSPVYTVQKKELLLVMERLYELLQSLGASKGKAKQDGGESGESDGYYLEVYRQLIEIFPFILDNQVHIAKLKNSQKFLTGITVEFYKLTS